MEGQFDRMKSITVMLPALCEISKFSRRRVWCSELSSSLMMEAVCTSETSIDNHFTRQYIPEDNSEHHYQNFAIKSIKTFNKLSEMWI
jgi:hypothetical protein